MTHPAAPAEGGLSADRPSRRDSTLLFWLALVAGTLGLVLALHDTNDPDYFWHLATGRHILEQGSIPALDPFSHTYAGQPWQFVDWLSDVTMFGLHSLGGHALVIAFFASIGGAAIFLGVRLAGRLTPRGPVAAVAVVAALLVAASLFRISPRPQTFTLLLLALLCWWLERSGARPWRALGAVPLIALWQNLHSSGVLGVLVLLAFAAGASVDRWRGTRPSGGPAALWVTTLAGAGALFLAPRPLERLLAGYTHLGEGLVRDLFPEWSPIWKVGFGGAEAAFSILVLLALFGGVRRWWARSLPTAWILAAGGLALLGAWTVRLIPLAAIALVPVAATGAADLLARLRGRRGAVAGGALALCALALVVPEVRALGLGIDRGFFPVGATAFVAREQPRGRMYNDFYFGGYLIWKLGGRYPVFVDGRSMAVYGARFVAQVAHADARRLESWIARYHLGLAIGTLDWRASWFQRRRGWALVYFDDRAFVAVRRRGNEDLVRWRSYRVLRPAEIPTWSRVLFSDPGLRERAAAEARRALRDAPASRVAQVMMALVEGAAGRVGAAGRRLEAILAGRPGFPPALHARLLIPLFRGETGRACREAARVLVAVPGDPLALRVGRALRCGRGRPATGGAAPP